MLVRLTFRAAAVAALVWIARELMRRWVGGPEEPTVAGSWETWQSPPTGGEAPVAHDSPDAAQADPLPAQRRPRPLKATRISNADPADSGGGTAKKAGAATKKSGGSAKKAGAAKKVAESSEPGAWVSPNGSGEAPSTHPVKAKMASRLYRVPGMPMYDRTAPDRCYATPEAAEADGFTRAAR